MLYNSQLESLVCVADCGSFSKAADKLYISSTAVMKQINSLEKDLNLVLFNRSNHGIELTAAGEVIYKHAKFLFDYSAHAIDEAKAISNAAHKSFRIGTSMLFPGTKFMELWYTLGESFKSFSLQLIPFDDSHENLMSEINAIGEKFDFIVGPCDSKSQLKVVNFLPIATYPVCLAVPINHRFAKRKELTMKDLSGEDVYMCFKDDSPATDKVRKKLLAQENITLVDIPHFYDMNLFNDCAQDNHLLLSLGCWEHLHPALVNVPLKGAGKIEYGILYSKEPTEEMLMLLDELKKSI